MKKKKSLYTELIVEINNQEEMNNIILKEKNITVTETKKKDKKYTTISYKNLEDLKEYQKVKEILIGELEKYLPNLANEVILVVGLGNKKSKASISKSVALKEEKYSEYEYGVDENESAKERE